MTSEDTLKAANIEKFDPGATKICTKAMVAKAESPEVKDALEEAIQAMAGQSVAILKDFEEIRLDLVVADNKEYKDKNGNVVEKLAIKWSELQQRYDSLLRISRDAAQSSVAFIHDYLGVIATIERHPTMPLDSKKAELQGLIDKVNGKDETHQKAVKLEEEFTTLSRDVSAFALNFLRYGKDQEKTWNARVDVLGADIEELDDVIKSCNDRIIGLSVAIAATVVATAVSAAGALAAFAIFGPAIAAGIVIAGILAVAVQSKFLDDAVKARDDAETKKKSKQSELDGLKADLLELQAIQNKMATNITTAKSLSKRIAGFAYIWTCVAADATLAWDGLKFASTSKSDFGMDDRIITNVALYTALAKALGKYARMLDDERKVLTK